MIVVGLTGGIGSGKSTVSTRLAARGAVVVDADAVTKELQQPGQPVLAAIVDRFGPGIVAADGTLDRQALADIVFANTEALTDLNGLVHPAVGAEIARRLAAESETDHVVVLDVPLLVESGRYRVAGLIVVDTPVDIAVDRLVRHRGLREDDARARIARQATREERLAKADRVIDNSGEPGALDAQIDELWDWISTLTAPEPEGPTEGPTDGPPEAGTNTRSTG